MLHDFLQTPRLRPGTPPGATRALVVVAAPNEAKPILRGLGVAESNLPEPWTLAPVRPDVDLVVTGISKANAAGAVARVLDPQRHGLALSLGIAGALPAMGGPVGSPLQFAAAIESVHVASSCVFADEGVEATGTFLDCAALGFPLVTGLGSAIPVDPALSALLASMGEVGPIATVSTCSGTDALAQRTAQRTLARVEAMEGAAVALVARRLGVPMIEVRVVSNTTGERARQEWKIRAALDRLGVVIERLLPMPR